MDFTDFTLRVLLLFIPGIIAVLLINRNTNTKDEEVYIFFMRALIYGFISYCVLMIIYNIRNSIIESLIKNNVVGFQGKIKTLRLDFFDLLNNQEKKINFQETIYVSIVSILIASIKSSFENIIIKSNFLVYHKGKKTFFERIVLWCQKFLIKHNIFQNHIGNNDVWNYLFTNLNNVITVRDWDNNLAYVGLLISSSQNHLNAEMYLENVTIVDMSGKSRNREVDAVYLCKDNANSWDVEFTFFDINKSVQSQLKENAMSKISSSVIKGGK